MNNKPFMRDKEWDFLKSHLNKNQIMLEYGSGSSTKAIAPLVKELYSIEHNIKWYNKVKENIKLEKNVNLIYVSPKNPKKVSSPADYKNFEDYINHPKTLNINFNVVLIDGRARQWVAESILPYIYNDTKVFIHDFTKRPRYSRVHNFYNVIDTVDTMVMLHKK